VSVGKSDFESDTLTARVQFGFWHGCEKPTAEPTATPTTEAPTEAAPTAQPTASPQQPTPTATTPAAATTAPTEAAAATATPLTAAMPPTPGAIQGLVFIDANGDGLLASDEPGVAGVTIQLRGGGMALSQVTSTAGSYSFGGLSPGAYEVSIELPWGYALTTSDRYSNVQVANDIVVGVDFGLTPLQYAAPTAEAGEPTLPSAGVAVLPAGGMLLGLAGIVGVLGLLGIAVEAGRSRRDIASNSRKDS
jgi:hypothetical protein